MAFKVRDIIFAKAFGGGGESGGGSGGGGGIDALIDGSLTEISSNVKEIKPYAFYYRAALTTANFPVATNINAYTFQGCSELTTINFPVFTTPSN